MFVKRLFLLLCSLLPASLLAEPANLDNVKQALKQYHDTGEYLNEITGVTNKALTYLKARLAHPAFQDKKPAIVLDIDETSLSNYPDMVRLDFGGTPEDIRDGEDRGVAKAIQPTLNLYRYARAHHVAVIFLTGRFEFERAVTEANLKKVGFNAWDTLILRSGMYEKQTAVAYKTAMRKKISEKGYDILLTLGDQQSDLTGGYADKTFKLPNPYYFIA